MLVHREALAGDHRFVDLAVAVDDHAVDGDLGSRPHQEQIAHDHLGRRDFHRLGVADDERLGRCEVEQGADRVVCSSACSHLEPVPEQHERRQHGRGLVEHLPTAGGRDHQRVQPPGADRDGDQHHHVQRARPKRPHRTGKEDRTGVEDHRQAQQQRPHILPQPKRHRHVQAQDLDPDRRPHHDRDREHQRHQEPVAHVGDHPRHRHGLRRRLHDLSRRSRYPRTRFQQRVADVGRHRLTGAVVAALPHPATQLGQRSPPRVEGHRRRLGHRIRLDHDHPWSSGQHRAHNALLRRPQHPADIEHSGAVPVASTPIGLATHLPPPIHVYDPR